jgi:type IV secretion system protein VirB9
MKHLIAICLSVPLLLAAQLTHSAHAQEMLLPAVSAPVVSDSRIRTLVYNPNEVYKIVAHYGYQSNIEFGVREDIQTISLGDQVAWQVVPSGRFLFIKPMESQARTNMTVVTSKHVYQFDLTARPAENAVDEELSYVIRFFYPEAGTQNPTPAPSYAEPALPQPSAPLATNIAMASPSPSPAIGGGTPSYNFQYTLSGRTAFAPERVFDDGTHTYFQFSSGTIPQLATVDAQGKEQPLQYNDTGDYVVVPTVASQFTLRYGGGLVCVFNETMQPGRM